MKKRSERCKHCAGRSNAEPKIFAPPQTPFPGVQEGQNLISWRWSLPSPTDPVWWKSMHAISSYRGNRPTHKQRLPIANTQTGPITIHCAAKISMQCNNDNKQHTNIDRHRVQQLDLLQCCISRTAGGQKLLRPPSCQALGNMRADGVIFINHQVQYAMNQGTINLVVIRHE